MSATTGISWTDGTWNPTRGCIPISPGCAHCYAQTFAERFRGVAGHAYEHGFDPRLAPDKLCEPVRWREPRMIFADSMSDLFLDEFSDDYIADCARVMAFADWHTYQVITKRPERMAHLLNTGLRFVADLPHIWWGVSVENRKHGVPRIDVLRRAPVKNRFLSMEPLLEDIGEIDLNGISWVIVGGESGLQARPIMHSWVAKIRDQCEQSGTLFHFKQWGGHHKSRTGRLLDGKIYDACPSKQNALVKSGGECEAFIQRMKQKY